jgi:tellurite resistance protein TerC
VWLNDVFGGKFPIEWSLAIILALLGAAIVASLAAPPRRPEPSADLPAG